ncbi:MAG: hypothetical protein E7551_01305 [Ruminococcaceae bacterium]|nr:hypothetical protein [Oscillospiraceae bacterium]
MKVTVNDRVTMADIAKLPLKKNLLKFSPIPQLIDASGNEFSAKTGKIEEITGAKGHTLCDRRHVQLDGKLPFTVTYTIESDELINKLLVSTYANAQDFGYGRYEVYLSNDKEALYSKENFIAEYDRREIFNPKDLLKGTAQIFTLDAPLSAKFFGIKFTHGYAVDRVVRLDFAGVFSVNAAEEQLCLDPYGVDLLESANIEVKGNMHSFDIGFPTDIETIIVRDPALPIKTSLKGNMSVVHHLEDDFKPIKIGNTEAYICTKHLSGRYITTEKDNLIGAFSKTTSLYIQDEVITEDFLGVGTNVLPFQLMPESTQKFGYDPEFIKLEHKAIRDLDIKIIRVWFQNDWFQIGPDEYDFESEKMRWFLEYMDVFRELGTEIELNFSWVVGKNLHSWYTIPEIPDQGRSAPRDTKQFARSVVAALKFLTDEKGYNIKYIAVSNEPENGNFAVTPDNNIELKKKYLVKTLKDIDSELKKAGLRHRFEIWGAEDSAATPDRDWLRDMHQMAGDVIDVYTKHHYVPNNDDILNEKMPLHIKDTNGGRIGLTEFACHFPNFGNSTVGNMISAVNGGAVVALHWCLASSVLTDPFNGPFDEDICLIRNDGFKNEGLYIEPICAEIGPSIKYIPAHSRVFKCEASNPMDVRAAVFEKDGDVTIVVETNGSGERDLTIHLPVLTDKPFKKLSYCVGKGEKPTEVSAPLSPAEYKNGVITEHLSPNHTMYLYTTI